MASESPSAPQREPHRINLRGPWQAECHWETPVSEELPTRVKVPFRWDDAFGTARGMVRLLRSFGRPTNLDPGSWMEFQFDRVGGTAMVFLNGTHLGELNDGGPQRLPISFALEERNELVVQLTFGSNSASEVGGLTEHVGLLIHEST